MITAHDQLTGSCDAHDRNRGTAILARAVPKLPPVVVSPARHTAIAMQHASVLVTSGDVAHIVEPIDDSRVRAAKAGSAPQSARVQRDSRRQRTLAASASRLPTDVGLAASGGAALGAVANETLGTRGERWL